MPSVETVRIPKDRVAVLIGKNGSTKKEIEKLASVELEIDSETGEVNIAAKGKKQEHFLSAANIVKAVGRGFSPKNALLLLDDENYLSIIDITRYGKTSRRMASRKGRVIGTEGKVRERIENETDTKISVLGKTISIIGKTEQIEIASKAVEMLLQGARHSTIFEFLKESQFERGKFEI